MRLSTAIIISLITLALGFFTGQLYLWVPVSVLIAGIIDLFTRQWVMSDRLGNMRNLSALLKFFLSLIGFYAMIGQIVCVGLIVWWFMG